MKKAQEIHIQSHTFSQMQEFNKNTKLEALLYMQGSIK